MEIKAKFGSFCTKLYAQFLVQAHRPTTKSAQITKPAVRQTKGETVNKAMRVGTMIRYCLRELLVHLHESILQAACISI